jgi:hypothetical protein
MNIQEIRRVFIERKQKRELERQAKHEKHLARVRELEESLRREALRKMELAEAQERVREQERKIAKLEAKDGPGFGGFVASFLKDAPSRFESAGKEVNNAFEALGVEPTKHEKKGKRKGRIE